MARRSANSRQNAGPLSRGAFVLVCPDAAEWLCGRTRRLSRSDVGAGSDRPVCRGVPGAAARLAGGPSPRVAPEISEGGPRDRRRHVWPWCVGSVGTERFGVCFHQLRRKRFLDGSGVLSRKSRQAGGCQFSAGARPGKNSSAAQPSCVLASGTVAREPPAFQSVGLRGTRSERLLSAIRIRERRKSSPCLGALQKGLPKLDPER